jgi:hypothetical protein
MEFDSIGESHTVFGSNSSQRPCKVVSFLGVDFAAVGDTFHVMAARYRGSALGPSYSDRASQKCHYNWLALGSFLNHVTLEFTACKEKTNRLIWGRIPSGPQVCLWSPQVGPRAPDWVDSIRIAGYAYPTAVGSPRARTGQLVCVYTAARLRSGRVNAPCSITPGAKFLRVTR